MPHPSQLTDIDHLRLLLAVEHQGRLALVAELAAREALSAAAETAQLQAGLRASYEMADADTCDMGSGAIARAPTSGAV